MERVGAGKTVIVRDEHVLQQNVTVLDNPQRRLVLDLADLKPWGPTIHNEPVNLIITGIAGKNDEHIRKTAVGRPSLLPIEDPPSWNLHQILDN